MGFLKNNPMQSSRAYPILSDAASPSVSDDDAQNERCRLGRVAEIWGAEPKSCCVKVVRLKGKCVRGPASRLPSRCGPSSGKHPNIRTSRPLAPGLECSDVRLLRQETRERVLELRGPVTVPREIGSLSRMNDDGTNIIVSQLTPRPGFW